MEEVEKNRLIKSILWDYDINPKEFIEVAMGERDKVGSFNQERALVRLFERVPWYDLISLFKLEGLARLLTTDVISKIRMKELREKYELARKVLQRETVPLSGWRIENRERIKHTLLSNRWYSRREFFSL